MSNKFFIKSSRQDEVYVEDINQVLSWTFDKIDGDAESVDALQVLANGISKSVKFLYLKGLLTKAEILEISNKWEASDLVEPEMPFFRLVPVKGTKHFNLERLWLTGKPVYEYIEKLSIEVVGTGTERQMTLQKKNLEALHNAD